MGMDAFTPAMARPGLEPVGTASPVMGMDALTAAHGETRTRTGDTTIFRRAPQPLEPRQNSCKGVGYGHAPESEKTPQIPFCPVRFGR